MDRQQAQDLWGKTCPHCQRGILHWASWKRKVRAPEGVSLPSEFEIQFSLCCSAEGCRRRVTPASVRFPSHSPNLAAAVILARIFASGPSRKRISEIQEILGVDERTIRRWLARWRNVEGSSAWWRRIASSVLMSGKTVEDLWFFYCERIGSISAAFMRLAVDCHTLWRNCWQ